MLKLLNIFQYDVGLSYRFSHKSIIKFEVKVFSPQYKFLCIFLENYFNLTLFSILNYSY